MPQLFPVFLDDLSNMKLWLAQFCILFPPPPPRLSVCAGCRHVWQLACLFFCDDMHFLGVKRLVMEWEFDIVMYKIWEGLVPHGM